ncbi:MAG TPA: cell division protein ZapA [Marinagarivorans sp.]|nr:cell division protein ZapA [Marinagarivorans sp.]
MTKPHRVTLTLLEKDYQIACPPQEQAALLTAAKEGEARMRSTRVQQGVVGSERIAVLVALNLCYELQQLKTQQAEGGHRADDEALQQMLVKLQAALDGA